MLRFKSFRSLRARVGNTQPLGQIWCIVCFCRIIIGSQICFMHIYLCIVLLLPPPALNSCRRGHAVFKQKKTGKVGRTGVIDSL